MIKKYYTIQNYTRQKMVEFINCWGVQSGIGLFMGGSRLWILITLRPFINIIEAIACRV